MVSFHRLIHYQLNGQLHHMDTFAVRGYENKDTNLSYLCLYRLHTSHKTYSLWKTCL